MRQMRLEGGFSGRTNKLVDGCYSFWVGSLFPLIETALRAQSKFPFFSTSVDTACESDVNTTLNRCNGGWLYDPAALQRYLLVCCQDDSGGLVDKPGKNADFYHTCYCLSGLATSQHTGQTEAETLLGSHRDSLVCDSVSYVWCHKILFISCLLLAEIDSSRVQYRGHQGDRRVYLFPRAFKHLINIKSESIIVFLIQ
jgi:hypothetical protein